MRSCRLIGSHYFNPIVEKLISSPLIESSFSKLKVLVAQYIPIVSCQLLLLLYLYNYNFQMMPPYMSYIYPLDNGVKSPHLRIMTKGVKYILISTIFFALMNIGVKYLDNIPAYEIVFFRALVSLIVCYFLIKRAKLNLWGNNKKYLILRGLAGTAGLMLYFYTLQQMPLASAVTIQYLSPIFTIIIAGFLLKEHPRPIQWLFFIVSFAGVFLIKGFDPRVSIFDLTLGITAAVCSGFAYNFVRKLKDFDHPLVVVFYFPLVTVPLIGTYTIFHWIKPQPLEWLILIGIGLATTVAQIYMTKGYQAERAANVSNFNYLGSIYAIAIGYLIFGETISVMAYLGIGLIIFGVLLSARFRK